MKISLIQFEAIFHSMLRIENEIDKMQKDLYEGKVTAKIKPHFDEAYKMRVNHFEALKELMNLFKVESDDENLGE